MVVGQRVSPANCVTPCAVVVVVFTGQCVLVLLPLIARGMEENVHTHVSVVLWEGPGYTLFSTDGSYGGGVHVCWGPPRVCFSSVCQQVNSLFILAAKLTGHTPLFTHSLSTYPSVYSLTHSICTSTSSFSSISVSLPGKLTHSLCLINP